MQIKKAAEAAKNSRTIGLIYGFPGVGKTTAALSMPNPVLIDCERGIGRVNGALRTDFVELNSLDEFNLADLAGYDTIVFDTLGVLLELFDKKVKEINPKLVKTDGALSLQGYGTRKILFKNFIADLRKCGKNVLFLAHVAENKDGDITQYRPYATGSSVADLQNDLDYMGFMQMRGGKRSISFSANDQYVAKNSLGLPQYIEVPEVFADNTFLTDIIVKGTEKRIAQEKEDSKKYLDLMSSAKVILASKKDLNEKTKAVMALPHLFDSKIRLWHALEALGKAQGLTFNRDKKVWEK